MNQVQDNNHLNFQIKFNKNLSFYMSTSKKANCKVRKKSTVGENKIQQKSNVNKKKKGSK